MVGDTVIPTDCQSMASKLPRKRKLRHPRATRACQFCRKRKVRCSGTFPCDYCVREEAACEYESGHTPKARNTPATIPDEPAANIMRGDQQHDGQNTIIEHGGQRQTLVEKHQSRRSSLEPPQTFVEGQHVGPTSGVSFLYHSWNNSADPVHSEDRDIGAPAAPLISYGDYPQVPPDMASLSNFHFNEDKVDYLLERYFRFAMPTYRFLHQPTLEIWAKLFVAEDHTLVFAKKACVLIACAQSLLHTTATDRYAGGGDEDLNLSKRYFDKAKWFLDQETGPASLASVQARLAMCLHLLSTFRMNECRFCFSFTATIITSLGLHRRQSTSSSKMNIIESESRRRVFWCAYIIDGYLGVMLGRPRLFRDEDIDQPYPLNIDDNDLMSSESVENLPQHGNLEAFVAHTNLAKLMAKTSDTMYPLHALTEEQVLQRTDEMLNALEDFHANLPAFLKPRSRTLTGQRTFERQNTVLKLAHAHVRILAARRCLLTDFSRLGRISTARSRDTRATRAIQECMAAVTAIIDAAFSLIERESLYQSFWFTQYISLVAISTLYVFLIQGLRNGLPEQVDFFLNADEYVMKAKKCQSHLASLAPAGSQAKTHHRLLDHLRVRAERDLAKVKRKPQASAPITNNTHPSEASVPTTNNRTGQKAQIPMGILPVPIDVAAHADLSPINGSASSLGDPTLFDQFTPAPDSDVGFQNMLDFGWESLDTIGFMTGNDGYDFSFG